jgi:AraC family transcriptional regulator of arabinose operon
MNRPDSFDFYARGYPADSQDLPLVINGFSLDYEQEPIDRPNGLVFNTLLQIVSGAGEIIIDRKKAVAQQGTAVFLKANTPYAYYTTTGIWITNFITFSGSICEQILSALHIDQSGVYHVADPENLSKHFLRIARIQKISTKQQHRLLSKALYSLLLDTSLNVQYITANQPAVFNESLQTVIQHIEEHYFEPISLNQLASLVNLRKEYLCTLFRKHMGQTIFNFIQSIRIAHARIYLNQFPEKTVQDISLMCGFENTSYFCRVFRQVEKNSPQKYRQLH